jgi:L-fuculose-phosphate aldolase
VKEVNEWDLRKDICEVSHRLYLCGFMAGSDGNVSTILNSQEILITPSRLSKGFLEPDQIIKINRQGQQISGDLPPSTEAPMHLAAYEERPDICSVVHCHPPILVAFTVVGQELPSQVLPEIETIFGGEIPLAPYATPGCPELAESIRIPIRSRTATVVLLDHHGLLAVGQDIYQAGMKAEHAEAAARIIFYARQLGSEKLLPSESLDKLHEIRQKVKGLEARIYTGYCHTPVCNSLTASQVKDEQSESMNEHELEALIREVIENYRAGR